MRKTSFISILDGVCAHDLFIFAKMRCSWQYRFKFHPKMHSCFAHFYY
jgi:hypothetical protein